MNIDELEASYNAATPGVWYVSVYWSGDGPDERAFGMLASDDDMPTGVIDENPSPSSDSLSHDLDYIVAAHNAMPELIAAWRERDELKQTLIEADRKNDAQNYEWNRAEARIKELERAVVRAAAPDLLTEAEKEALADFVKFLREAKP